ncbi:MAG: phosphatase PAP2 family protein [Salinivirgaceae bacterium]|nr:phosphatase PAP2 family protein [Salinivirgaceae bacterium]
MKIYLKRDVIVFLVIFTLLSIPFLFTNLDIALQKPYFTDGEWFLMNLPFWDFIYKYGIFLGYFVAVVALVVVSVSYWSKKLFIWRKAAYFMLFVMLVGPGVLVNGTFKDHWGRPRPREIKEFGGKENFHVVWEKGDTKGKSFPCGHASMGFYLAIPFLFLRKRYKKWAWIFFITGTLYGLLVGYARMIAGGHFASDVLWSAGMVWLTGILGYYLLKVYKEPSLSDFSDAKQKRKGKIVALIMGLFLPILTIGLLLATPYISKKEFTKTREELDEIHLKTLNAQFDEGVISVGFGNDFKVNYAVNAFGFPNSKIRWQWEASENSKYWLENMGWFTEIRNEVDITYPIQASWENVLNVEEGDVFVNLQNDTLQKNLIIKLNRGQVEIFAHNSKFALKHNLDQIINEDDLVYGIDSSSNVILDIEIGEGTIVIKK